jgi:hypothetical protein
MSKRRREVSSSSGEDDEEEMERTSAPKRSRVEQSQSTPSILSRLLAIQQARGGPQLQGTWREGQHTIELDRGDEIRRRRAEGEWVDSHGLVMDKDRVAEDDPVRGPNTPFGPRAEAVFIAQQALVEEDSLTPLLEAVAGAIDVDVTAMFEDAGVQERQQQNAVTTEWNRNEMRTLMTNAATKKDALDKIRDELYRQQQVIDGHVEVNATIRALRDLSNVMFPNTARYGEVGDEYKNPEDSLRHGNHLLVHILAGQRLMMHDMVGMILQGRGDGPLNLDDYVSVAGVAEQFNRVFFQPHEAHIIDNDRLKPMYLAIGDTKPTRTMTRMTLRTLIPWVRRLDYFIWLRDEVLVDFPQFKLDYHDPKAVRVRLSASTLIEETLTAAITGFVAGVFHMRQIQFQADPVYRPLATSYGVSQYPLHLGMINEAPAADLGNIFKHVFPNVMMGKDTFANMNASFMRTYMDIIQRKDKRNMDLGALDREISNQLKTWKNANPSLLEKLFLYVKLSGVDNPGLQTRTIIRTAAETLLRPIAQKLDPQHDLFDAEAIVDLFLSEDGVGYTLVNKELSVNENIAITYKLEDAEANYIFAWRHVHETMLARPDFFGTFSILIPGPNNTLVRRSHGVIDVMVETVLGRGQALVDEKVFQEVYSSLDRLDNLPLAQMGGLYASGIRLSQDNIINDAIDPFHVVPTGTLIAIDKVLLPILLGPLEFALFDTLVTQKIVVLTPDDTATWDNVRLAFVNSIFSLPKEPAAPKLAVGAKDPIRGVRRVLSGLVANLSADSFNPALGPTRDLMQTRVREYLAFLPTATMLPEVNQLSIPAIFLAAHVAHRVYEDQKKLVDAYNDLMKTYETVNRDYQRMTRGEPNPNMQAEQRRIRELVHQPDPNYLRLPMFTGQLRIKAKVAQAMDNTMLKVRQYCPGLRTLSLNDLAHTDPAAGLIIRFAEFLAATYSLKRLIWPDRFKKDKEYAINWKINKDTIEPLKLYKVVGDTLTHPSLPPYHWPLKWRKTAVATARRPPLIAKTI